MKRIVVLIAVLVFGTTIAIAQTVKPGGFTPAQTETTEPAAPATEETPAAEEAAAEEEEVPVDPVIQKLDAIVGQTAGAVQGSDLQKHTNAVTSAMQESTGATRRGMQQLKDEGARQRKNFKKAMMVQMAFNVLTLAVLVFLVISLRRGGTRRSESFTSESGKARVSVLAIMAIFAAMIFIFMAQQTHAAPAASSKCEIRSIITGGVIVKGQDAAPITIATQGCDKEARTIAAATAGVTFSDVKSEKGKVTAKVVANSSSATGPWAVKITFADNSEAVTPDSVYLLILDAQTALVRKDVSEAKAEAAAVRKQVRAVEKKFETAIASRPTSAEVSAMISPLQTRIAQLERELADVKTAQAASAERLALLNRATEILAEGQRDVANTRQGWRHRPINKAAAAAAEQVRLALASPEVEAQQAGN